jgi:hypothetical protein
MSRSGAVLLLVAVVVALPPSAARAAESPTAEQARRSNEVRKKLAATVNFSGFDDPETKLDEALQHLTKLYDISFEVNDQAFRDEMIDNLADKALGKALPKMNNVTVEAVLRRILARIPSTSGATFVVRGGVMEITTRRYASPSRWGTGGEGEGGATIPAPETSIAFEKRDLKDALQEIADATGVNIVLDARAGDKGKTVVSATMRGVGVDTAVQLLANMADLTVIPVENVLYVTTKENAKALRADILKLEPAKAEAVKTGKGG